jgi:hypothetical protein
MNRFGAFAVHLGLSLIIFFCLGYLILYHWYPDFFFASDGVWQGIRIVAMVDLVLGPTLTLIVYKKGKPRLRFDLTTIAAVQMICLAAGVWVVYSERPIAMVFADGSFHSMAVDDYVKAGQPVPDMSRFPGDAPQWVSLRLPEDPAAQSEIRRRALESSVPVRTLSQYYEPFEWAHVDWLHDGYDAEQLLATPYLRPTLDTFRQEHGDDLDSWLFIRFATRYRFAMIAVRKGGADFAYLALPYEDSENQA